MGAESLHGETSNNPLYQLAQEHQLLDIDDRKINELLFPPIELFLSSNKILLPTSIFDIPRDESLDFVTRSNCCLLVGESDRDDCYHDEDTESIDEDVIDEIRKIYDEILEKQVPTYPYENYPDLSLGEFVSAEFEQYIEMKKSTLDNDEIDERRKVIDWLSKSHPYLNMISCNKLTDVSVQGMNSR